METLIVVAEFIKVFVDDVFFFSYEGGNGKNLVANCMIKQTDAFF